MQLLLRTVLNFYEKVSGKVTAHHVLQGGNITSSFKENISEKIDMISV
jgi:hypothetical protein